MYNSKSKLGFRIIRVASMREKSISDEDKVFDF